VVYFAKDGIDVNFHNTTNRDTALMIATRIATTEPSMEGVVKSLLARDDVDPNILDFYGLHALMYSILCQGHGIVKSLLDRPDVDINLQTGHHRSTALMWAVSWQISHRCKVDSDKIRKGLMLTYRIIIQVVPLFVWLLGA
jgi:ankyrin repeat protein